MKSKNVKVIDQNNIDREANVIFALELDGSEYVVYWISRDEESNNIFVSKVLKNIDGTYNMLNIDDEEKKKEIIEIVKMLISNSVSDQKDKLEGTTTTLSNGKVAKFVSVSFNKEQHIDVTKTYITTVKKEVTKVAEGYYDVAFEEAKVENVLEAVPAANDVFPEIVPSVASVGTVVENITTASAVDSSAPVVEAPAPVVTETVTPAAPVVAPVVETPVVTPAPTVIPTPVVAAAPVLEVPAPVVTETVTPAAPVVAPVVETPVVTPAPTVIPTPVVAAAPVLEAPAPVVTETVTPAATVVAPVVETPVVTPVPTVIPTPVVAAAPVVEAPAPVATETVIPAATVVTPASAPANAPLVFNAAKETNLNAALGEVANSTAIPVENIASVREFGVEEPVPQPASVKSDTVAPMVQPEVSSDPKVLTKKAGFANSKFFMVVAIAFFLASCVFLGYEVYNYFQLVK